MLPRDIPPPQTFGSFEVLEFLGQGGMGRTFKAKHQDRIVAHKVPLRRLFDMPGGVDLFLGEARAALADLAFGKLARVTVDLLDLVPDTSSSFSALEQRYRVVEEDVKDGEGWARRPLGSLQRRRRNAVSGRRRTLEAVALPGRPSAGTAASPRG
jgi:hypothetical protein